eukprot:scaffold46143_cov26-Tisochrysis_lutea.AAC.2
MSAPVSRLAASGGAADMWLCAAAAAAIACCALVPPPAAAAASACSSSIDAHGWTPEHPTGALPVLLYPPTEWLLALFEAQAACELAALAASANAASSDENEGPPPGPPTPSAALPGSGTSPRCAISCSSTADSRSAP